MASTKTKKQKKKLDRAPMTEEQREHVRKYLENRWKYYKDACESAGDVPNDEMVSFAAGMGLLVAQILRTSLSHKTQYMKACDEMWRDALQLNKVAAESAVEAVKEVKEKEG